MLQGTKKKTLKAHSSRLVKDQWVAGNTMETTLHLGMWTKKSGAQIRRPQSLSFILEKGSWEYIDVYQGLFPFQR